MVNKKERFAARLFPTIIPAFILAIFISGRWIFPSVIENIPLKAFDVLQRLKPRAYEDVPVRIVDIDDESLSQIGQWPWPRTKLAELVNKLTDLGANVIVFDVVFAEPDRTSSKHLLNLLPETSEFDTIRSQIGTLPDSDQLFAKVISESKVVTGFSFSAESNDNRPQKKAGFSYAGDNPLQFIPQFRGTIVNISEIETASSGNGSFAIVAESDGIIRRVPLLFRLHEELYPSLAIEAVRVLAGAKNYIVKSSGGSGEANFGEHTGISSVKVGPFLIPTDNEGRFWLYDTSYQSRRWIPAWQVLDGQVKKESLTDAVVFIGTSAAGLKDIRSTPLNPVAAGVEIHAQLVEQILLGGFLRRPDWVSGAEFIYTIFLGLLLILLMPHLGALWCALIGGISVLFAAGFSWYMFRYYQWLIDPILPSAACFIIYLIASLTNFLRTESKQRQIKNAFSHYLSPSLVARLAQDPGQLKLGGETRNITILFADIRGFTSISEKMSAQELTGFMNQYLTPMSELILKQNGTIDKFIGDCIMAFWNAPLNDPNHGLNACSAALRMRDFLIKWNQDRKKDAELKGRPFVPVRIGVGINTGDCCVGNIGSEQRFDYSVLGDDVNLASRLQNECKSYGVDIIIGEKTREKIVDYAVLEIDFIRVRGKEKPVRIFALLGDEILKKDIGFQLLSEKHQRMLSAFRAKDWTNALRHIDECLNVKTIDVDLNTFYKHFDQRIRTNQLDERIPL